MFQKTAASFDEGSTAGVFLSTLHCQDYRSELLFPSDAQILPSAGPPEMPDLDRVEMTDLKGKSTECPSLQHVDYQRHLIAMGCAKPIMVFVAYLSFREGSFGVQNWASF